MAQCRASLNVRTITCVLADAIRFASSMFRPRAQLAAENLFLRKQLALYVERQVRPRRADDAIRLALVGLSRLIAWRQLLIVVKPETLIRWHRKGFGLFWRWKSRPPGRPRVPANLQRFIAEMAAANCTWGEERIAELSPPTSALSRASSRHSGQRGDCQRAASLISEQGSAHHAGATCGPGSSRLLFPTQGPVGLTVGTTVSTRCHAAASTDAHLSHAADRLASARVRRAAAVRDVSSAGTASPVREYISS